VARVRSSPEWRRRQEQLYRVVAAALSIGFIGFALMLVGVAIIALEGGYRPLRYEGRLDPIRAPFVLMFGAGAMGFGAWFLATLREFAARPAMERLFGLALTLAVTIIGAALAIMFSTIPAAAMSAPGPREFGAVIGAAGILLFAGFLGLVSIAARDAFRSRDWVRIAAAIATLFLGGLMFAIVVLGELRELAQVLGDHQS
jgi:hypothetical protein